MYKRNKTDEGICKYITQSLKHRWRNMVYSHKAPIHEASSSKKAWRMEAFKKYDYKHSCVICRLRFVRDIINLVHQTLSYLS